MSRRLGLCFAAALIGGLVASPAEAQFRRDGERRDGERRDGERSRGPIDFKQFDKNGDGQLDSGEVSENMRRFMSRTIERAGLDPNQPLSVEKLNAASIARAAEQNGGAPPTTPPSSSTPPAATPTPTPPATTPSNESSKSNDKKPLVPGFGEKDTLGKVPGFDVPLPLAANQPIEKLYDPRVVERVQRALRENDANSDGILDSAELKKSNWSNPPAEESDLNKDGKLSKHELAERYAKRYGWRDPPGAAVASSSGNKPASGGEAPKTEAAKPSGDTAKYKAHAEGLLKQNDADKNGLLEKSEWAGLKSEYHSADQNGDHVITLDELTLKVTEINSKEERGRGYDGGRGRDFAGGGSSSSGPNPKTIAAAKKAGRFLTATERLPKGLPDWFIRNDADGDGQVGMSEYAVSWTDAAAAEFEKYDLNGDGFVTPEECLEALKTSTSAASKK